MASSAELVRPHPSHVPASRVHDFDFHDDPLYAQKGDMHDAFLHLLNHAPGMFWTPRNGGHWIILEHDLVAQAMRTPEIFSSVGQAIPAMQVDIVMPPIMLDPPEHAKFRAPLNKAFSPKSMHELSVSVRALAAELIERIAADGQCDFVSAISEPLPVLIFMKLMGMPTDRLADFREWVHQTLSNTPEREIAYGKVAELMAELIDARIRQPQNDLISRLIELEIDGEKLSRELLLGYCQLLFIAGLDTVVNGMSFAIRHMARNPVIQEQLRADPARIPDAVEEMLRRYPIAMPGRRVARDVEWNGIDLRAGDLVLMAMPAAHLDPKAFPDPQRFDLDRENVTHITFGTGVHRCAGSHLARIELQILYEEWLKRIPSFHMAPDKKERFHAANVLSIDYLPLVWNV